MRYLKSLLTVTVFCGAGAMAMACLMFVGGLLFKRLSWDVDAGMFFGLAIPMLLVAAHFHAKERK